MARLIPYSPKNYVEDLDIWCTRELLYLVTAVDVFCRKVEQVSKEYRIWDIIGRALYIKRLAECSPTRFSGRNCILQYFTLVRKFGNIHNHLFADKFSLHEVMITLLKRQMLLEENERKIRAKKESLEMSRTMENLVRIYQNNDVITISDDESVSDLIDAVSREYDFPNVDLPTTVSPEESDSSGSGSTPSTLLIKNELVNSDSYLYSPKNSNQFDEEKPRKHDSIIMQKNPSISTFGHVNNNSYSHLYKENNGFMDDISEVPHSAIPIIEFSPNSQGSPNHDLNYYNIRHFDSSQKSYMQNLQTHFYLKQNAYMNGKMHNSNSIQQSQQQGELASSYVPSHMHNPEYPIDREEISLNANIYSRCRNFIQNEQPAHSFGGNFPSIYQQQLYWHQFMMKQHLPGGNIYFANKRYHPYLNFHCHKGQCMFNNFKTSYQSDNSPYYR